MAKARRRKRRDNWWKHLWGVQSNLVSGELIICVGFSQREARWKAVAHLPGYETWREMYRAGYRCVKVTVTKGWTDEEDSKRMGDKNTNRPMCVRLSDSRRGSV